MHVQNPEKYERNFKEMPKLIPSPAIEEVKETPTSAQDFARKINETLQVWKTRVQLKKTIWL